MEQTEKGKNVWYVSKETAKIIKEGAKIFGLTPQRFLEKSVADFLLLEEKNGNFNISKEDHDFLTKYAGVM